MRTVAESIALPLETKTAMLNAAKGGTWYEGWAPPCYACDSTERMSSAPYGFQCGHCGSKVGFDLNRLADKKP